MIVGGASIGKCKSCNERKQLDEHGYCEDCPLYATYECKCKVVGIDPVTCEEQREKADDCPAHGDGR